MSAEAIAAVVRDLRDRRVLSVVERPEVFRLALRASDVSGPAVDATEIYRSLLARDDPVDVYGDHPCIAPPWTEATLCYQNEHGNIIAMSCFVHDRKTDPPDGREPWEAQEECDWDRVRWVMQVFVWAGGRSKGQPAPTHGPRHLWQIAVYDDGEPADIHWVHLVPDYPMEYWDMASLVLLGALNFLNCRNVELVEPQRTRAESRRLARTGVSVQTINVFPTGRSASSAKAAGERGRPLTSVRGHFAEYGPRYGKGKLFGKLEGRFWVPQHARGAQELGEIDNDYVLRSGANNDG